MKSYKSLRAVASAFKAIGYGSLLLSMAYSVSFFNSEFPVVMCILFAAGAILIGVSIMTFWLGVSQLILLMINVADDVSTIATNAYAIAQKASEKKIDENEL